jgi:HemY protein
LRAADVASATRAFPGSVDFRVLAHLLAGMSMHRLQDRAGRDRQMTAAQALLGPAPIASALQEGTSLLAAEWALDDRQAATALQRLASLPAGVARRTHALRLKLQAARMAPEPQEALRTARLLAKHQGFSKTAAEGLLRSLAIDLLSTARDKDQLERAWVQLDPADRRDPLVCAHGATLAVELGALENARLWLRPHWDDLSRLAPHEREAVLAAFVKASRQLPAEWLPSLESALQALPLDPWVAYAAGVAMVERGLWGRAVRLLKDVAEQPVAPMSIRGGAWLRLAQIAEDDGDTQRAAECYRAIGRLLRDSA